MTINLRDRSARTDSVRHFNRFYTKQIGVLQESLLNSGYSLSEVRVLYELAHRTQPTAKELGRDLGLDAGYLSRILANFEEQKFLERKASESDGRQILIRLTKRGQSEVARLESCSRDQIDQMLKNISESEQKRLLNAMKTIESVLDVSSNQASPYILRTHQPGDMGWVVHRHGALYGQEYGWNSEFEALVAEIVAKFLRNFDADRERCWIAEKNSEIIGSVFLVKQSRAVAKLRLLLVEPSARGLGVGNRLVEECINFARLVGYKKITLWTNDILHRARRIYERAGFHLIDEEKHHSFGHDLVAQTWELDLQSPSKSL
ncbi:MAG: MarR family transcriptional regulator [Cyanobacteria bacterium SZAS-4]|nr:MarR family transcriptional regulator [Cyanobacteria bacterium SZAS-4]